MRHRRSFIPFILFGILILGTACGKKAPPFISRGELNLSVIDLKGEWAEGYILLKGKINGPDGPVDLQKALELVKGCRVYYGQYSIENPPCEECPINYRGYHGFGQEVITEEGFFCPVPGKRKDQIYFFKVHLIGQDGVIGPPSERVRVVLR